MEYEFSTSYSLGDTVNVRDFYVHVTSAVSLSVVRGMWLYRDDTGL